MFRAPCMSQRRLALIFCVSVLIVLLIALILLCEWSPSPGWLWLLEGTSEGLGVGRVWQYPHREVPKGNPWPRGREVLVPFPGCS